MTIADLIKELLEESNNLVYGLDSEIEFATGCNKKASLLSMYSNGDNTKLFIDIGNE